MNKTRPEKFRRDYKFPFTLKNSIWLRLAPVVSYRDASKSAGK